MIAIIPLLRPVLSLRLGREVRQVPVKWAKDDESFKGKAQFLYSTDTEVITKNTFVICSILTT